MTPPLAGIRAIDHGHVWAGPLLGQSLADMGAEVIKVQSPGRASGVAMAGQALPGTAGAGESDPRDPRHYQGFDRGKRSITLDLQAEAGRAIYTRLAAISDVIIENFSPGVLDRLGLGYDELSAVNPGLIMASLSAAGATPGPWRNLVTYGPSLAALYGVKSLLGYHDDPMPREDTADLDPTAAGHAFVAILAALEYRQRTGKGQFIDMAQGEATIQRIAEPVMDYLVNGRVAGPQGNRYGGVAPHGIYRAAGEDNWLAIVARDETEWQAVVALAREDGHDLDDRRFATLASRLEHQEHLDAAVERWTAEQDAHALAHRLQEVRVPGYPVMSPPTLLEDPNYDALRQREVTLGPEAAIAPDQLYTGVVWKLPKAPGIVQGPVPAFAVDNGYVYGELLGIPDEEQARLRAQGVI